MRYYSVKEVAKILNISKMSIYRYIDEGRIRAVKLRGEQTGCVKIPEDAIIEYLRENTTTEIIEKMKRKKREILRVLEKCKCLEVRKIIRMVLADSEVGCGQDKA